MSHKHLMDSCLYWQIVSVDKLKGLNFNYICLKKERKKKKQRRGAQKEGTLNRDSKVVAWCSESFTCFISTASVGLARNPVPMSTSLYSSDGNKENF